MQADHQQNIQNTDWLRVNQKLVAKSISELGWEEYFTATVIENNRWQLALQSGIQYRFSAWSNIWGQLIVDPNSLARIEKNSERESSVSCARQFYIDAAVELKVTPETLANLLEEIANTLMADHTISQQQRLTAAEMVQLNDDQLQALLDGHPKITANKGRMGWGSDDYLNYATENSPKIQLLWLAVDRKHCQFALSSQYQEWQLVETLLNNHQQQALKDVLAKLSVSLNDYCLIPVHPWQWQNKLLSHFAGEIGAKRIIYLGAFGDSMRPLQSLRTLSNHDRPQNMHIKLPLTILNTSCYRGIPGQFITAGPVISHWLAELAAQDEVFSSRGMIVLQEPAGAFYPHPLYQQIENSPYRFQEMLGCIWRESVMSHLDAGEQSILMSVLFQTDANDQPLIFEYIEQSGMSSQQWLAKLFDVVVVPLYHLLCCYGVGWGAHGQNISLVLKNGIPQRVAIKDFQGDLRLAETDYPQQAGLPESVKNILGKLPEHYLLHDLLTGHFVTVLRFISTVMSNKNPARANSKADQYQISEVEFYQILAQSLTAYMAQQPQLTDRFKLFDLFQPEIARICLHRVRFRLGYGDSSERPVPELGTPLANPLLANTQLLAKDILSENRNMPAQGEKEKVAI